jgi:hypothetical protein
MTRMIFATIAALTGVFFGLPPAQANQASWCAVIELSKGSAYWDCQYSSFDDCALAERQLLVAKKLAGP